jgi:hypothetical protein
MANLIFVYSIPRETATGVSEFVNDSSGRKLKKTKIGRCDDKIMALYDPKIGGLRNYISYTPWVENGVQVMDEDGKPLMLQDKLERKWNKSKGYFTNRPPERGYKGDGADLPYFQTKYWALKDGCTVFDLSKMDDEMGYYVLLASSRVANSEREWREYKWPKANWYIALENESEEIKYSRNAIKSKAFAALHDPNMTDVYKRKIVSLMDIAAANSTLSTEQVHNLLFNTIDTTSFTPGSNVEKFLSYVTMLSTADGRIKFEMMWLLRRAIDSRVIYEKQGTYTWIRPTGNPIVIGERYDDAIDFLLNPKKSSEVEEITEQIEQKLK